MKLKDFIHSQGLNIQDFKNLDKSARRKIRKMHEEKNQEEQRKNAEVLKERYRKIEEARQKATTDEEIYKSMYWHLYEVFGPRLNRHVCSGELKLTKRCLSKYCKSQEQYNRLVTFVEDHGGFCDCEVLLNCPPNMTLF